MIQPKRTQNSTTDNTDHGGPTRGSAARWRRRRTSGRVAGLSLAGTVVTLVVTALVAAACSSGNGAAPATAPESHRAIGALQNGPAIPGQQNAPAAPPAQTPAQTAASTTLGEPTWTGQQPASPPSSLSELNMAPGQGLHVGLTMFAAWRDWERLAPLANAAASTGVKWIRVDIGWCSLEERGPGIVSGWYQQRLDTIVDTLRGKGFNILMTVGCTPTWDGQRTYHNFPNTPAQFQRAMGYLANRYAGRVQAWEIWNEPDCTEPMCTKVTADSYLPVLRAGFAGVRAGDPDALVVSGGISGNDVGWVLRLYELGGNAYFDVLATHPYIDPTTGAPELPAAQNIYRINQVAAVRQVMEQNGDAGKPIWFTEYGWSTPTGGDRPGVSETVQADYLRRSVAVMQQYSYVTAAFWFCLRDRDDSTPYENSFGLLRVDGSQKPAFSAFAGALSQFGVA
ncbi:GH39 family glycosyl hydrolase [Nakamurella aerolata]|uniref:Glycosyl hydrolases family 39 N-terminal catalytic domain-containing protein n=1 Tax=Nakamurella aerolata TaxID=1656892 RepID=A0A849A2A1_9ACTN|nr:cellulase family glycosylhydrolase [Nakamurella aerolata]NNG35174.1 hypothetical protein [Nakamurella aerolata]